MARRRRGDHDRDDRRNDHDRDDRRHKRRDDHDKDDRKHKRRKPKPKPKPRTVTERLKESSKQSGAAAMGAAPGLYPADPANSQAVFTTGPGEAIEYNYVRVDGGQEEYALATSQQSAPVPPIAGYGQTVTSGAANNPT